MKEYILSYEKTGEVFNRGKRWAFNAAKRGDLDFARLPGRKTACGITIYSIERLMRQAAKQPKAKGCSK